MNLFSTDNNHKKTMNKQIYNISKFLATKQVYILQFLCVLIFIFLHIIHETRSAPVYVLFILCILPLFFPNIIQKREDTQRILPHLSQKYKYTNTRAAVQSASFFFGTITFSAWQFGNILTPYSDRYSQYYPLILLIAGNVIRICLTIIYYFKLRNELLNNSL